MTNKDQTPERYALISVSDKTGIAEFARTMVKQGFRLLSTGGTATALREAGIDVKDVSEHTGFPEMMAGRVKTLHPLIHGGILGRDCDAAVMEQHGILPIDLVVVNLYPFESVTADPDCSLEDAIDNIDIGGPAMVRSAAKNHQRVAVVTDPEDYPGIEKELAETGHVSAPKRFQLAVKAFAHTARYDTLIAAHLGKPSGQTSSIMPEILKTDFVRSQTLRYGENPHQNAAFYHDSGSPGPGFGQQLQGKELSYNNIADADAAWECVLQFSDRAACIIVKHANPCGSAAVSTIEEAYELAYATDPVSAFGGIIAFNREAGAQVAARILEQQFVELVIAPGFSEEALRHFSGKPNVRVLAMPVLEPNPARLDFHQVGGGMLIQQHDSMQSNPGGWKCVTIRQPDSQDLADLEFAWKMVRMVKSNAIVYAKNCRTLGIGAGQMSRVDSARIAAWKAQEAGLSLQDSAMASDAFFPFRDSIDAAAKAGVKAIIQPGGSMRDDEVIAAADEHGMSMVFTGIRHFRH